MYRVARGGTNCLYLYEGRSEGKTDTNRNPFPQAPPRNNPAPPTPTPPHTEFMYIVYLRQLSKRNEQEGVAATGSSEYL